MDSVRSLLLVPAGDISTATAAGPIPDATLLDLMPTDPGGYAAAAASVTALIGAGHRLYLHSRGPQAPDLREQLLATLVDGVYGLSVPGVVHADQLHFVDSLLEDIEGRVGIEPGLTAIGLWIENAAALAICTELAKASSRLTWLGVSTTHLAMELGLDAPAPLLLDHARLQVVLAAAAAGLPTLEGLHLAAARPDDGQMRALGLRGRLTRDAAELPALHAAFPGV